ncbi:hypothetical protein ES705_39430 [subsurface metagenome]
MKNPVIDFIYIRIKIILFMASHIFNLSTHKLTGHSISFVARLLNQNGIFRINIGYSDQ